MTESQTLPTILRRMTKLATSDDAEGAHSEADDLLLDALRALAPENATVGQIVAAYEKVDKWYE